MACGDAPKAAILLVENAGTIFENIRHGRVIFWRKAMSKGYEQETTTIAPG